VGDDQFAKTRPKIATLPRGIRVERWTINTPTQEYDKNGPPGADSLLRYDYLAPGILLMHLMQFPAGTAKGAGFAVPTIEPTHANFTSQAVTPLTELSSRYFYSWGPRSCEARVAPNLVDGMMDLANRAFEEDRRMIEAQQRNLLAPHDDEPLVISHDRGPLLMREVLKRLIDAENVVGKTRATATA
jgi:vanillate O-demethylase monooxygenase subunit